LQIPVDIPTTGARSFKKDIENVLLYFEISLRRSRRGLKLVEHKNCQKLVAGLE